MQPTYLPWSGYFNLILKSDHFIFLDDAQYRKNYWHNRNRIILNGEPHWITVPVRKVSLSQSINDTLFDDKQNWRSKHIRLISQNYAKHPFAADLSELFSIIEDKSLVSLGDLSIAIILWACEKLNLNAQIHRASQLGIKGQRTNRIVSILAHFNAHEYLSPIGASEYLSQDEFIKQTSSRLTFQNFTPKKYPQLKSNNFISHLSFIDALANIGWDELKNYIS
jgi:hypothetical protein